jgi:hypothetical protein
MVCSAKLVRREILIANSLEMWSAGVESSWKSLASRRTPEMNQLVNCNSLTTIMTELNRDQSRITQTSAGKLELKSK